MDKLHDYQSLVGRTHLVREEFRERWTKWKEEHPLGIAGTIKETVGSSFKKPDPDSLPNFQDYLHVYRKKSRRELIRVSAAVMGIEFSYAAETAFVSPTLLKIGVEHKHMTLVWALSPLVGFFVTPVLGSVSDRCTLNLGRRRPFIILMAIGVLLGLILVPNGEYLGYKMGDFEPEYINITNTSTIVAHRTSAAMSINIPNSNITSIDNQTDVRPVNSHPWGVFFTILGTVLLDFDADACQSPARAYLLDVTLTEDHARGLSTFTIMAGLGGFFGYALGGINWDITILGALLGGHVRAVFTLITIIFIICVTYTITSFKEIPLNFLEKSDIFQLQAAEYQAENLEESIHEAETEATENLKTESHNLKLNEETPLQGLHKDQHNQGKLGTDVENPYHTFGHENNIPRASIAPSPDASLLLYLQSIVFMPHSLRMLCLTNLFCWMAHVCYSLYFTDFVGEAVFNGNPTAVDGSKSRELYEQGVRFGCWGMSMYSLSCACYSMIIEKLIVRFRARRVYVGGLLIYCTGMLLMAVTKHKVGVILFSWTAGVMYSTLFTMPYLLIAHYHAKGTFTVPDDKIPVQVAQIRGLGTDIAIVSSMVFLAQFILSMCMGSIVSYSGTTTAVVSVASGLSFCGALSATQVMYLDL